MKQLTPSVLFVTFAFGCAASSGTRIPAPLLPKESDSAARKKTLFEQAKVNGSEDSSHVQVGGKDYPPSSLPRYYEDSGYETGADATKPSYTAWMKGIAIAGGFVALWAVGRSQMDHDGFGIWDAMPIVGVGMGVTWVIYGWPDDAREFIPRFNEYLANRMDVPWPR